MLRNLFPAVWVLTAGLSLIAQPPLYPLREMDMHLHAGMERDVDLDRWVDLAAADGRRVIVLLDHLELYRRKAPGLYPMGAEGQRALMADFDAQRARRKDLNIFKGWEILEDELDTGVEAAPMRMADVLGWHISWSHDQPPDGQLLIRRVRQLQELRKQFPVPMILFHPFAARIRKLQDVAKAQGRDVHTITVAEYRFFHGGEQAELIRLLKNSSIYVEISYSNAQFIKDPACREALIADVKPLADAGVQFAVSTDAHKLKSTERPFHPEVYCEPLGVTPQNTNAIVRELMASRKLDGRK